MKRHSAGFLDQEDALLAAYATPGSTANTALNTSQVEIDVASVSSAIRALVLVGHRTLEEDRLLLAYDRAVASGETREAEDWYRGVASGIVDAWSKE